MGMLFLWVFRIFPAWQGKIQYILAAGLASQVNFKAKERVCFTAPPAPSGNCGVSGISGTSHRLDQDFLTQSDQAGTVLLGQGRKLSLKYDGDATGVDPTDNFGFSSGSLGEMQKSQLPTAKEELKSMFSGYSTTEVERFDQNGARKDVNFSLEYVMGAKRDHLDANSAFSPNSLGAPVINQQVALTADQELPLSHDFLSELEQLDIVDSHQAKKSGLDQESLSETRHTGKIHPPLMSSQYIFKKLPQQGGLNLGSLIGSDSYQNLQASRLMPKDCSQRLDSMGAASGVAVELGEKALKIDPIAKISPKSSLQGDTQMDP